MAAPKRVVVFCAVSSDEQASEGKMSIPDQLARQRERAAVNGWLITDEIVIEGFSRRFYTFLEFAKAAADAGHRDALRMFAHWESRDFEILSCRDLSRLGREQSILSEVIARTIDCGAVVSPLDEAQLDSSNYRMIGAIGGVGASDHIDKLKRWRDSGMKARAARGEMIGGRVPKFYKLDVNNVMQPDRENFQRFFDDFAELFLVGVSYNTLPQELKARGHVDPLNGKLFRDDALRRLLFSVRTWGGAEFNRTGRKRGIGNKHSDLWAVGRAQPPSDVYVVWNVCEPIWQGREGEAMKDEIERRHYAIRGSAHPRHTYPFTGLCVCAVCGSGLISQTVKGKSGTYRYLLCPTGVKHTTCTNARVVPYYKVQDALDDFINRLAQHPDTIMDKEHTTHGKRLDTLDKEINRLTVRITNLIDLISEAPVNARNDYQNKITLYTSQRETLLTERDRVMTENRDHEHIQASRREALASLRGVDIWTLSPTEQNQRLRKLLGRLRVLCDDSEVIGLKVVG